MSKSTALTLLESDLSSLGFYNYLHSRDFKLFVTSNGFAEDWDNLILQAKEQTGYFAMQLDMNRVYEGGAWKLLLEHASYNSANGQLALRIIYEFLLKFPLPKAKTTTLLQSLTVIRGNEQEHNNVRELINSKSNFLADVEVQQSGKTETAKTRNITDSEQPKNQQGTLKIERMSKRVFIVHGHHEALKQQIARTLEQLKLEPIILHERANGGKTIIEKFEAESDVGFAVVLLTGDDLGKKMKDSELKPRARQNVVLELGYFMGKLGRNRVMTLMEPNLELPSDVLGQVYTVVDERGAWRYELARELKEVGYIIDINLLY